MSARLLYCHCQYAQVIPPETKTNVLQSLCESGVEFEAVADLCEMSARKDPRMKELANGEGVRIAACFARAVKGLFKNAGAPLPLAGTEIINMRVLPAGEVTAALLAP